MKKPRLILAIASSIISCLCLAADGYIDLPVSSGGGGTPGGSTGQFQFNNSGSFAGSPNLVNSSGRILVGGATDDFWSALQVKAASDITISAPASITAVENASGTSSYSRGQTLSYEVYSKKQFTAQTIYSASPITAGTVTLSNDGDGVDVNWAAVSGVTEYRVVLNGAGGGGTAGSYQDISGTSLDDEGSGWMAPNFLLYPTIYTPPAINSSGPIFATSYKSPVSSYGTQLSGFPAGVPAFEAVDEPAPMPGAGPYDGQTFEYKFGGSGSDHTVAGEMVTNDGTYHFFANVLGGSTGFLFHQGLSTTQLSSGQLIFPTNSAVSDDGAGGLIFNSNAARIRNDGSSVLTGESRNQYIITTADDTQTTAAMVSLTANTNYLLKATVNAFSTDGSAVGGSWEVWIRVVYPPGGVDAFFPGQRLHVFTVRDSASYDVTWDITPGCTTSCTADLKVTGDPAIPFKWNAIITQTSVPGS